MSSQSEKLSVESESGLVAEATVHIDPETRQAHADFRVEAGPQPTAARGELVESVLDHAAGAPVDHLTATLPHGDAEMLLRLRDRLPDAETHVAGSTVQAEGDLPRPV